MRRRLAALALAGVGVGLGGWALLGGEGAPVGAWIGRPPPVQVTSGLAELRADYAPRPGLLSEDEARAVIAAREDAADALSARIAAGGAPAVAEVRDAWEGAASRERLLLIRGLRDNTSPEAVSALADLYAQADLFRVREEILRALGEHALAGAHPLLLEVAAGAEDERLSQIAAGALFGEEAALDPLAALVRQEDAPMNTRLEAIHSLGGIGDADARAELSALAGEEGLPERVRVYATKEAERAQ